MIIQMKIKMKLNEENLKNPSKTQRSFRLLSFDKGKQHLWELVTIYLQNYWKRAVVHLLQIYGP